MCQVNRIEKIQWLNPNSDKQGARISAVKYEEVKETILEVLKGQEQITFKQFMSIVSDKWKQNEFEGSPSWHCTAVKLDLEARGIIKRENSGNPQKI
ncbi:DUF6958 family protein [Virgibacillus xinjiangensis]|uniref:DUF6958 family protein n=1 Tax=Virgibacillus xinjiangensis TaxID=393090 RepID=A0ABV7CUQ8_9BACI